KYKEKEEEITSEEMRNLERFSLLSVVDEEWRDHLHEMDLLKEGISFRAYAQKDPLIEYKKESLKLFEALIYRIQENVSKKVFTTYIIRDGQMPDFLKNINLQHAGSSAFDTSDDSEKPKQKQSKIQPRRVAKEPSRNDKCPCGSGKKYKNCCGKH
ncbi:MAG: SEC-C metal-binding domain-containing protein, partial [Candidatus Cloacimonadota bacterium]|nr:SEC-C metal-binding domain-containing protein [Candidatus Cloacimonadota bacterium]